MRWLTLHIPFGWGIYLTGCGLHRKYLHSFFFRLLRSLHVGAFLFAVFLGPEAISVALTAAPHKRFAVTRLYVVVPHLLHGETRPFVLTLSADLIPI